MVSFGNSTVFVLGSSGKVYESKTGYNKRLIFSSVVDLNVIDIVGISGIENNVLAVSKEGIVFGLGKTKNGIPKIDKG